MHQEKADQIAEEDDNFNGYNEFIERYNPDSCKNKDSVLLWFVIGSLVVVVIVWISLSSCEKKSDKMETVITPREDNVKPPSRTRMVPTIRQPVKK